MVFNLSSYEIDLIYPIALLKIGNIRNSIKLIFAERNEVFAFFATDSQKARIKLLKLKVISNP
jgi:hypothetical protein